MAAQGRRLKRLEVGYNEKIRLTAAFPASIETFAAIARKTQTRKSEQHQRPGRRLGDADGDRSRLLVEPIAAVGVSGEPGLIIGAGADRTIVPEAEVETPCPKRAAPPRCKSRRPRRADRRSGSPEKHRQSRKNRRRHCFAIQLCRHSCRRASQRVMSVSASGPPNPAPEIVPVPLVAWPPETVRTTVAVKAPWLVFPEIVKVSVEA